MNEATDVLDAEPVFVDPTGRRRRIARRVGIALSCVLGAYLVTMAFGLVSGARVPLTPWPGNRPSTHALPAHTTPAGRHTPSRTTPTAHPTSSRPRDAAPLTASGADRATRSMGSATPTPTFPGKGRGYGRSRAPHPKRT